MSKAARKHRRLDHRRPGRPRAADADQRARLLDAALECYATQGVRASSGRSIAAAAGVTPALVNYYFGSKEQLLMAVVSERLMPLLKGLSAGIEAVGDEPRELIAAFVRGIHAAVARHPWLPALWVREILTEGGALRDLMFEHIGPQIPRRLAERLAAARERGALPRSIDPRLLVVSLVGLTLFPLAAASIWQRVFDASDLDAAALADHTLALLENGLGGSS